MYFWYEIYLSGISLQQKKYFMLNFEGIGMISDICNNRKTMLI